jgi:uncharacterized protein YegJ (DUF2314 family)
VEVPFGQTSGKCSMRFARIALLLLLSCGLMTGCGSDDVVEIAPNDHELTLVMIKARQSSGPFLEALKDPQPNEKAVAVKRRFEDGDKAEYMWLTELRWEDGRIVGTLANEPSKVENVEKGQEYTVAPDEICDWLMIEDGKQIGGFTDALLQRRRTGGEE